MSATCTPLHPSRPGPTPIGRRIVRRWPGTAAALIVAMASWVGAVEVARDTREPVPISQALRALARLMRGKAGGEALRAASRRIAPAVAAGRQPSELRWLQAVPPAAREP